MILTPGFLSFAKLVMMSSAPGESAGDDRYASQDPFIQSTFIQSTLAHTISIPIRLYYQCVLSMFNAINSYIFSGNSNTDSFIAGR